MTIHQRIKERRQELGLTLMEVAKRCGLSAWQTVQHWEHKTAPIRTRLPKVAEVLGVTEEWLLTGRGSKTGPNLVGAFSELSGQEAQLVMFFRTLTPAEQGQVLNLAFELSKRHQDAFGGTPLKLPEPSPAKAKSGKAA